MKYLKKFENVDFNIDLILDDINDILSELNDNLTTVQVVKYKDLQNDKKILVLFNNMSCPKI